MDGFLTLISFAWRYKFHLFVPLLFIPALFVSFSVNKAEVFEATTTLYVEHAEKTPLLQNLQDPKRMQILERTLHLPQVLESAVKQVSAAKAKDPMFMGELKKQIRLESIDKHILQMNLRLTEKQDLLELLGAVTQSFITEVLTPERMHTNQTLNFLAEKLKSRKLRLIVADQELSKIQEVFGDKGSDLKQLKELAAKEFETQHLRTQYNIAKEEYDAYLKEEQSRQIKTVIRFVEEPTFIETMPRWLVHVNYLSLGLMVSLVMSLILITLSKLLDSSLRTDKQIKKFFDMPVLGRMPKLGDMSIEKGRIQASVKPIFTQEEAEG